MENRPDWLVQGPLGLRWGLWICLMTMAVLVGFGAWVPNAFLGAYVVWALEH